MIRWISPAPPREFTEGVAWWPVRAFDVYSQREAWVWLREVRRWRDGRVTFSSFWC